jgi:hypothetical protein
MDEYYLQCAYPHPHEVDLVIEGRCIWSDVGWRMAIEEWQHARELGFDGFIFPAKQTPDEYFVWNQNPPKEHYLNLLAQRSERS